MSIKIFGRKQEIFEFWVFVKFGKLSVMISITIIDTNALK